MDDDFTLEDGNIEKTQPTLPKHNPSIRASFLRSNRPGTGSGTTTAGKNQKSLPDFDAIRRRAYRVSLKQSPNLYRDCIEKDILPEHFVNGLAAKLLGGTYEKSSKQLKVNPKYSTAETQEIVDILSGTGYEDYNEIYTSAESKEKRLQFIKTKLAESELEIQDDSSASKDVEQSSKAMREWMRTKGKEADLNKWIEQYNEKKGELDNRTKAKVYQKIQSLSRLPERGEASKNIKSLRDKTQTLNQLEARAKLINYAISPVIASDTKYQHLVSLDLRDNLDTIFKYGRHINYCLINNSLVSMYLADALITDELLQPPNSADFDENNPDPRPEVEYNYVRRRSPMGFFTGDFILEDYCIKSSMKTWQGGYRRAITLLEGYYNFVSKLNDKTFLDEEIKKHVKTAGREGNVYLERYHRVIKIARFWLSEKTKQAVDYLNYFDKLHTLPGFIDQQQVTFDHVFTYSLIAYFINRASAVPYSVNIKPLWNEQAVGTDLNHIVNINSVLYKNENSGIHTGAGGKRTLPRDKDPQNGEITLPSKPGFRKNFMVVDPLNNFTKSIPDDLREGLVYLCKAKILPKTILERFIIFSPKVPVINYKTQERSHFYKLSVTTKTFNKKLVKMPRHYIVSEKCNKLAKFYFGKYYQGEGLIPSISTMRNINYDYSRVYQPFILQPVLALLYSVYVARKEKILSVITSPPGTTSNNNILKISSNEEKLYIRKPESKNPDITNVNSGTNPIQYRFVDQSSFSNVIDSSHAINKKNLNSTILKNELVANYLIKVVQDLTSGAEYKSKKNLAIDLSYETFGPLYAAIEVMVENVIGNDRRQSEIIKQYSDNMSKAIRAYESAEEPIKEL